MARRKTCYVQGEQQLALAIMAPIRKVALNLKTVELVTQIVTLHCHDPYVRRVLWLIQPHGVLSARE